MSGLYLLGVARGVGKTLLGAALATALARAGLRVTASKPIELGCEPLPAARPLPDGQLLDPVALGSLARLRELAGPPPVSTLASLPPEQLLPRDTPLLAAASNVPPAPELAAPARYAADLDPSVAARLAGRPLSLDGIAAAVAAQRARCDLVIVEGVSGLCTPLTEHELELDLLARLALPALLLAPSRPGVVHLALSSLELLRGRGLPCAGVVLVRLDPTPRPEEAAYPFEIERFAGPLVRGVFPYLPEAERAELDRVASRLAVHVDLEAIIGRPLPPAPLR